MWEHFYLDEKVSLPFVRGCLICSEDERTAVLNWLSEGLFNETYNNFQLSRVKDSGQWFLSSPQFQSWVTGDSTLLIVPGDRTYSSDDPC